MSATNRKASPRAAPTKAAGKAASNPPWAAPLEHAHDTLAPGASLILAARALIAADPAHTGTPYQASDFTVVAARALHDAREAWEELNLQLDLTEPGRRTLTADGATRMIATGGALLRHLEEARTTLEADPHYGALDTGEAHAHALYVVDAAEETTKATTALIEQALQSMPIATIREAA